MTQRAGQEKYISVPRSSCDIAHPLCGVEGRGNSPEKELLRPNRTIDFENTPEGAIMELLRISYGAARCVWEEHILVSHRRSCKLLTGS